MYKLTEVNEYYELELIAREEVYQWVEESKNKYQPTLCDVANCKFLTNKQKDRACELLGLKGNTNKCKKDKCKNDNVVTQCYLIL